MFLTEILAIFSHPQQKVKYASIEGKFRGTEITEVFKKNV